MRRPLPPHFTHLSFVIFTSLTNTRILNDAQNEEAVLLHIVTFVVYIIFSIDCHYCHAAKNNPTIYKKVFQQIDPVLA